MPTTSPRRIVSWAVMALAGVVLLLSGYVSAWVLVSRAALQGHIGRTTAKNLALVFAPIKSYCHDRRPGWKLLSKMWIASMPEKVPNNGSAVHVMVWRSTSHQG